MHPDGCSPTPKPRWGIFFLSRVVFLPDGGGKYRDIRIRCTLMDIPPRLNRVGGFFFSPESLFLPDGGGKYRDIRIRCTLMDGPPRLNRVGGFFFSPESFFSRMAAVSTGI